MDAGEIRDPDRIPELSTPDYVTILPPREGFSPHAVGAVGLLVHRMGQPGDVVIGQAGQSPTFPGRHFVSAEKPLWPLGRTDRYIAGAVRSARRLNPRLIEVHNRPSVAVRAARACPDSRIALFLHNDPLGMRQARTPAERTALLARMTVVCVSRHLARRFMDGLDQVVPAPLVLPNAIDFSEIPAPLPPELRDKQILFVGRMVADKGGDIFVDACAKILPNLPGWRATMIGADRFFPGAPRTPFERDLLPRAHAAGIELRGYLPHADVLRAMSHAAIVAVPSRWPEPFGMTALEALACGAALVCSMTGGLPEVTGDAALPATPDTFADAITTLARDAALRTRLSEQGRARARRFDALEARARLGELREQLSKAK